MTASVSHPCRVVIAEDNQIFRASLVRFLATFPTIEVIAQATNGQEALQWVDASAPDLLLLDLQMPKMDGIEVLRHLQAKASKLPVVVLSAHGENYASEAMASGATAFVRKGDIDSLVSTLTKLLIDF